MHGPETRRLNMQRIRSRDTKPELMIRRGLHARGHRFRLHVRDLPGTPDLVFPRYRAVIQVHGCFWHGHDCALSAIPKTNTEFWAAKIAANIARDKTVTDKLGKLGWRHLTIWECALRGRSKRSPDDLMVACETFLKSTDPHAELSG